MWRTQVIAVWLTPKKTSPCICAIIRHAGRWVGLVNKIEDKQCYKPFFSTNPLISRNIFRRLLKPCNMALWHLSHQKLPKYMCKKVPTCKVCKAPAFFTLQKWVTQYDDNFPASFQSINETTIHGWSGYIILSMDIHPQPALIIDSIISLITL